MRFLNIRLLILLCLTLGLAPYRPQPHVVQKISWMFDPAQAWTMIDRFDLAMHAAPWVLLILAIIDRIRNKPQHQDQIPN